MDVCERDKYGKVGCRRRESVVFQDQEACKFVREGTAEIRKEGHLDREG